MRKGLTKNERRVLYGLVKHPTLNDRQLSDKTKVKHSTITAIRRRLHQSGYFRTIRIPVVNKLGYELTVMGYGRLNPSAGEDLRNRFADTMKKENKGLYYFLTSPDFYFFVSAARNYTSFRRSSEAVEFELAETRLFSNSERTSVILPFEATRQVRHFDYSRMLSLLFNVREKVVSEAPFQRVDVRKLTKKERRVLRGLVEHPELTDVDLSEKIDASRQVISSMKKRFEKTGLIMTKRVVDLQKLGYNIYTFAHVKFNPSAPLKMRLEGIQKTSQVAPQFLSFSGNSETVLCGAFKNYDDFFGTRKELLTFYAHREFIAGEPRIEVVALGDMDIPTDCDFSVLIKEAVENLPQ